jgi:5-aminolevulinate synthase
LPSETHIVPVHVGDPEKCKSVSNLLLWKHGIYIRPINYLTVPRGHERLRITPSPHHSDKLMDHLAEPLTNVWDQLKHPRRDRTVPVTKPRDSRIHADSVA